MSNSAAGWTPERRLRQSQAIRQWRPWEESKGPTSSEGRARSAFNAWRGGQRAELRNLSAAVNAEIRLARELLDVVFSS